MKLIRTPGKGIGQRLLIREEEFESIAIEALEEVRLLPHGPGPVRIDDFVERYFQLTVGYEDLPPGVLGATGFRSDGTVESITVAEKLADDRYIHLFRSTLAHEAGHGLLHRPLFSMAPSDELIAVENFDSQKRRILCRESDLKADGKSGYDGRWWEYQANRMIGTLLLPKPAVMEALRPCLDTRLITGLPYLKDDRRPEAIARVAADFTVSTMVAKIRLDGLFPPNHGQIEF